MAVSAAQPVRTPRESARIDEAVWTQMRDILTLGCRFSTPESDPGAALAPAALDRACGCMGRRFAERARVSELFRAALRADDRSAISSLARALVVKPDGRRSFAACVDGEASLGAWVGCLFGR